VFSVAYLPNMTSRSLSSVYGINGLGEDAIVNTQNMYSPANSGEASETSCAMTIAQIDQALRDFVLQDTAQLRGDTEAAGPQMVSEFHRRMAGTSLTKLDETITDLSQLRDFLHAEGERIKREISSYLQSHHAARCSTKLMIDHIEQCRAAAGLPPRLREGRTEPEGSNATTSPSPAPRR
jgi:hypothetical protein